MLTQALVKKAAKAAYDREYRRKNAEKIRTAKKVWGRTDAKKDGDARWAAENRARRNEIQKAYRDRHPERLQARRDETKLQRNERMRAYYITNAESIKQKTKDWRAENPQHASALAGKRAKAVRRATPAWADQHKMRAIYKEARQLGLEVDHEIPLQGKNVSGLHVENNLRAVPREVNRQKGNSYAG